MKKYTFLLFCVLIAFFFNCKNEKKTTAKNTLFELLPSSQTGVTFRNDLKYNADFNVYTYRNFYNGGGVAVGDVNNDGLQDIYMSSNMSENHLYLNKGAFKFEDVTPQAGVGGKKAWSTGVAMADVNGDGWLDIYVCNSGDIKGDNRANELFINQKNGTFSEKAEEYGLADRGYGTHAVFLDYDHDGDLDMYLLNNSFKAIGTFNLQNNLRNVRDSLGGDKLFRNEGNQKFIDVSEKAGIYGSLQGFGLGVTVGDVNRDGWQDLYISNDFFERDYLYINQKNGTFREDLENQMRHISAASMGADLADLNNDAYPDLFATDMLPEKNQRLKQTTSFENWNKVQYNRQNGYYEQFTHNALQINNGNNTFSETAFLSGVGATDWSWGALITDLDNDGWKDIFVANGIAHDLTDQDYLLFLSDEQNQKAFLAEGKKDFKKLIDTIPSTPIPNYAFQNNKDLTFTNRADEWGLGQPSFSNGSAYADLDNDGDLDLIVNNINAEAFVYKNKTNELHPENHFLKINLQGEGANTFALGAAVTLKSGSQMWFQEQMPMRGFQSSMDYRLNFGVGKTAVIDTIFVDFPNQRNGKRVTLTNVKTNQTLTVKASEATSETPIFVPNAPIFANFQDFGDKILNFQHQENPFSDFDEERLVFNMNSTQGAKMAVADVNADGLEDVYIGGAKDQAGALFLQQKNGNFTKTTQKAFEDDRLAEDVAATFFDADGDKDMDLYVCSGGSDAVILEDRVYKNNGKGTFERDLNALPIGKPYASGTVRAADYDGDGDMDLFVGMQSSPRKYGVPVTSFLMRNDGKGKFNNATQSDAPELDSLGMVTAAEWADMDGDKDLDLVVVGDWQPITIFENDRGKLRKTAVPNTKGWWRSLAITDIDGNGKLDIIAGNWGYNSRFRATTEHPTRMYVGDFDQNGTAEQLFCTYEGNNEYPCVLRNDLVSQMPSMKKKYLQFSSYANQTIEKILTPQQMKEAIRYEAQTFATSIILNKGKDNYEVKALPITAQFSPIFAILAQDFDKDGKNDLFLMGNFFETKPEMGRYDANYGTLLKGNGKGDFSFLKTNLNIKGAVRDAHFFKKNNLILISKNNEKVQAVKIK